MKAKLTIEVFLDAFLWHFNIPYPEGLDDNCFEIEVDREIVEGYFEYLKKFETFGWDSDVTFEQFLDRYECEDFDDLIPYMERHRIDTEPIRKQITDYINNL